LNSEPGTLNPEPQILTPIL